MLMILTSCQSSGEEVPVQDKSTRVVQDIFKHHYSVSLHQFGMIMKKLGSAQTVEDLIYANGMVDGYLTSSSLFVPGMTLNESELNQIVDPSIREDVLTLFKNKKAYLQDLKRLLDKKDLSGIQERKDKFNDIYKLERQLNDDRIVTGKDNEKYKEQLAQLSEMIRVK
ncbi:hypothetical protein IC619_000410 [Hazenella sp. IB182353]|nr:hypothetical protein [Polycladospora coralii]